MPDAAAMPFVLNAAGPAHHHFIFSARGHADAAIAQFRLAIAKGPHFADPLEGWGEALFHAGKKDEAAKHLARAATLDLAPSEKAELQEFSANRT